MEIALLIRQNAPCFFRTPPSGRSVRAVRVLRPAQPLHPATMPAVSGARFVRPSFGAAPSAKPHSPGYAASYPNAVPASHRTPQATAPAPSRSCAPSRAPCASPPRPRHARRSNSAIARNQSVGQFSQKCCSGVDVFSRSAAKLYRFSQKCCRWPHPHTALLQKLSKPQARHVRIIPHGPSRQMRSRSINVGPDSPRRKEANRSLGNPVEPSRT